MDYTHRSVFLQQYAGLLQSYSDLKIWDYMNFSTTALDKIIVFQEEELPFLPKHLPMDLINKNRDDPEEVLFELMNMNPKDALTSRKKSPSLATLTSRNSYISNATEQPSPPNRRHSVAISTPSAPPKEDQTTLRHSINDLASPVGATKYASNLFSCK